MHREENDLIIFWMHLSEQNYVYICINCIMNQVLWAVVQDLRSDLYLQSNKKQSDPATRWFDSNVRVGAAFNCILRHILFKQEKEWSLNYKNIVPLTTVDCAAGHWDGNLATMAYFSVLSDCGKISLFYSDIFPFFSYDVERDWWRQQQKKNNYRQREGTSTQNSIMLFRRVNHFRKGSEDKPF